jgi:glyoxylase-like metal-dependent hydrolase (beta-lactamase superfamily II)
MRELQPGLWHWKAPHPDWTPAERWPREVSSYAIDDGTRLLLFDPQSVPRELLDLAARRTPVVVLSAPWHERDTRQLVEGLGATVVTPPADTARDLIDKYGITAEQAGEGSPDLAWLRGGDPTLTPHVTWLAATDRLPMGIEAFPGREHNDLELWITSRRALVCGDTLVDFGTGFGLNEWLRGGISRDEVVGLLRPLLDLPIELVLPAHGEPTDRAALERALA